jgi:hypothetical protein
MTRRLAHFAIIALAVSAVCLGLAARLGAGLSESWPQRVGSCTALTYMLDLVGAADDEPGGSNNDAIGCPPAATMAWEPTDSLDIRLPAQVSYRPGPQPEATVSGEARLISHVRLDRGRLEWDRSMGCVPRGVLMVRLSGPAVRQWTLTGSSSLDLADIKQDRLAITTRGHSKVVAGGEVQHLAIDMAGSGRADLGRLAAQSADIRLRGSAIADLAPRDEADISIAGSARVRLHGRPQHVRSHVSGSGSIEQLP